MSSTTPASSDTRRRILDAALDVVADPHAGDFTVGRVARQAGVSRQAVYLHFPNLVALALDAARWLDEREGVVHATAPIRAARTAETMIDAYARFLGAYNPRIAPVVRMCYRLRARPEMEAAWQDRLAARRRGAESMARQLRAWGRLTPSMSVAAATDWITAVGSVRLWDELTGDLGWSQRRFVEHVRRGLRATLLAPR
jgi:AcrR family transcriptional regulator